MAPSCGAVPSFSKTSFVARLAQGQHDAVGATVTRAAALDVGPLAPHAVRQALQLLQERSLGVVDDALHHALDDLRTVAPDQ